MAKAMLHHFSRYMIPIFAVLFMVLSANSAFAQATGDDDELLSEAEIEQLVAPIALHPDALLSQILMASTYPMEIVEASRWLEKNPDLKADALEEAMAKQDWDPSVKSLTSYPQVLDMMNTELSWTQQLGDAFLAQQEDVLAGVQILRERAEAEGNLESTEQQTVKKESVTTESGSTKTVIIVEPADPEIIYVPAYNPTIVYGTWAYPSYPPYAYYPPGYVAGRAFWFGVGVAVGHSLWGDCHWGNNKVNINVNNYNRYNRTKIKNPKWNHNPKHRKGAPYRNRKVAAQHGKRPRDAKARENFRGRADAGRRDLAERPRGKKPDAQLAKKKRQAAAKKSPARKKAAAKKPAAKKAVRKQPKAAKRQKKSTRQSAYKGVGKGKSVKRHSSRGNKSRSANRSRKPRGGGGRRR
jgi:hypothetical protein